MLRNLLAFSAVVAALLGTVSPNSVRQGSANGKTVLCYFGSWSVYRHGDGKFDVEDIDPFVCTHLVYGFAGLDRSQYTIRSLDQYNDLEDNYGKGAFRRFTKLKEKNPSLKTILAIGGWNEGSTGYSEMSSQPDRRQTFIASVVALLKEHHFDGFDLDWEYPAGREDSPGLPEDRENHAQLLRELRSEFDKHGFLLTAAVSAGWKTIDKAYDVPAMAETLDFINVMTYDFHGAEDELEEASPGYRFNTEFAILYWIRLGAKREQLLLGVDTYGRGFVLADPSDHGVYAPTRGGLPAGPYTQQVGYWGYNEFCEKRRTEPSQWTLIRDEKIVAPYVYKDDLWFGYDDEVSVAAKATVVLEQGLGGAFVWSVDTDDVKGFCGRPNGLLHTLSEVLNGGVTPPTPTTVSTTTASASTTSGSGPETSTSPSPATSTTNLPSTTTQGSGGHPICGTTSGIKPDPVDCHDYYMCELRDGGQWIVTHYECGPGTAFNPDLLTCDWPENVPGCV